MRVFDNITKWMTPNRAAAFSAIGQGLSQMSAGRPADLTNAHNALVQRQQRAQMRRTLDESGLMQKFSPEQRAILAQMEPSAAQRIIASQLFAPKSPTEGVNVGGRLVNPVTGQVMYEPEAEAPDPIQINGQLVNPQTMEVMGDFRDPPPPPGAPTVKTITLEDGSEVAVEWRPDAEDAVNGGSWVPIDAPAGGSTPRPHGSLSENESKLALFGNMQDETSPVLEQIEETYNPANIQDAAATSTPIAGNFFKTEQGQIYGSAAEAWAEGALRIATGAAATQPEIERVKKTYFAQPGDTPRTVQFKKRMREMYRRSIDAAFGRASAGGSLKIPLPEDFEKEFKKNNPMPEEGGSEIPKTFSDSLNSEEIARDVWEVLTDEEKALWKS